MATAPSVIVNLPGYPFTNLSSAVGVSGLRAIASSGLADGQSIAVQGIAGNGGLFQWSSSSTATDDGAYVVRPNDTAPLQSGRWLLDTAGQFSTKASTTDLAASSGSSLVGFAQAGTGSVNQTTLGKLRRIAVDPEDFGAVGNGIANDTAALQRAINQVSALGGGAVRIRQFYYCATSITIAANVILLGDVWSPAQQTVGVSGYGVPSQIRLASTATINSGRGSGVIGCNILRAGMALPVVTDAGATAVIASFAGTAITVRDTDFYIGHCLIAGFNLPIDAQFTGNQGRLHAEQLLMDNTNGLSVIGARDLNSIQNVECWPELTAHVTGISDANLQRSGTGFYIGANNEFSQLYNLFCYGYYKGFSIEDAVDLFFIGCASDFTPTNANSVCALEAKGASVGINLIGFHVEGYQNGLVANSTIANKNVLIVSGGRIAVTNKAIDQQNGYVKIRGVVGDVAATFFHAGAVDDNFEVVGCSLGNITTAYDIDAGFTGYGLIELGQQYAGVITLFSASTLAQMAAGKITVGGCTTVTGGTNLFTRPALVKVSGDAEYGFSDLSASTGYREWRIKPSGTHLVAERLSDDRTSILGSVNIL